MTTAGTASPESDLVRDHGWCGAEGRAIIRRGDTRWD